MYLGRGSTLGFSDPWFCNRKYGVSSLRFKLVFCQERGGGAFSGEVISSVTPT